MPRLKVTATASVVAITALLAASAATTGTAGAASPSAGLASLLPTLLPGNLIYHLSQLEAANAHEVSPATTPLTLGVAVSDRDPAGAAAFEQAVQTPGSAVYRDFLTPAEYDAQYGPTPATIDAVAAWLSGGGLTVVRHPETPEYLTTTGTTGQIAALMKTSFVTFTGGVVSGIIANTVAPTVPAAVLGVAGLNTGARAITPHPRITKKSTKATGLPNMGGLDPSDLWSIYDQPANDTGQGQGLALFGEGTAYDSSAADKPSVESDLRDFEKFYGLPKIPYTLNYFKADPSEAVSDDMGYDEWTLDAQAAQGMAPDADQLVDYFGANGNDPDVLGSYAQWVDDPTGPLQGSTSYGPCEDIPASATLQSVPGAGSVLYLGNPNQDMYSAVYARGAAEGKTLFSASGDTGQCPVLGVVPNGAAPTPTQLQFYPGDDPSVVGVGGTVIYDNPADPTTTPATPATRFLDYPWNDSGGGFDPFIPAPTYQATALQPVTAAGTPQTVAAAALPIDTTYIATDHHGTPFAGGPELARLQPDVSALSGDITGNGYNICGDGTCDESAGGTSLASPLWLGLWTRLQAAAPANNKGKFVGVGFALPILYKQALAATYKKDYYDPGSTAETPASLTGITNGSAVDAPAAGGFDALTGWGEPHLSAYITDVTGSTTFTPTNPTGAGTLPPPPSLPESPIAVLLPVLGLGIAGVGAGLARRRRGRRVC